MEVEHVGPVVSLTEQVRYRLAEGECVVFDNLRVLHGRGGVQGPALF